MPILGAVNATILVLVWVSVKLWSLWDLTCEPWNDGGVRSDEIEFAASFQANAPVLCLLVVVGGGLLPGLLGRTAAMQRAPAPLPQSVQAGTKQAMPSATPDKNHGPLDVEDVPQGRLYRTPAR